MSEEADEYREEEGDDQEEEEELASETDDFDTFFHDVCQGIRSASWQPKFNPSLPTGWTAFYDALEQVVDQHFYRK